MGKKQFCHRYGAMQAANYGGPIGHVMCRLPCNAVHATIDDVNVTIDDVDVTIDDVDVMMRFTM